MARSENNLTAVFTDTANAIREKTGKTQTILPRDFADEINNIPAPSGSIIFTQNGEYNVGQYLTAVVDIEGGDRAKLYAPTVLNNETIWGKLSSSKSTSNGNGNFNYHYKFYIDNVLFYEGESNAPSDSYYPAIHGYGPHIASVAYADSHFIESDKYNITLPIDDSLGYFIQRWGPDEIHDLQARIITNYTLIPNEDGDTLVINGKGVD